MNVFKPKDKNFLLIFAFTLHTQKSSSFAWNYSHGKEKYSSFIFIFTLHVQKSVLLLLYTHRKACLQYEITHGNINVLAIYFACDLLSQKSSLLTWNCSRKERMYSFLHLLYTQWIHSCIYSILNAFTLYFHCIYDELCSILTAKRMYSLSIE